MKGKSVAYLHGLESKVRENSPKALCLREHFDYVYEPSLDYRAVSTFDLTFEAIRHSMPDLIMGSSMGGYFAYLIGAKLGIPTILFNPAVVGRSIEPIVDTNNLTHNTNYVYLGDKDTVINGTKVKQYFDALAFGEFHYQSYDGGHRVPFDVFEEAIKTVEKLI